MSSSWFYVILLVTFMTAFLSLVKAEGKNLGRAQHLLILKPCKHGRDDKTFFSGYL